MIDLLKNSRKSDVFSIWSILGSKWVPVIKNQETRMAIESMWHGSELLANSRLNELFNLYNRYTQTNIAGLLPIFQIQNIKTNIKKNNAYGYNYEFRIKHEDLKTINGSLVKHVFPPAVFTNTLLAPEYIKKHFSGYIYRVYPKDKKLNIAKDDRFTIYGEKLEKYIFIDSKNNPFRILKVFGNTIHYESLFSNIEPIEGEFHVVDRYELRKDEDYIAQNYDNIIKFQFKEFLAIDSLDTDKKSIFSNNNYNLYSLNVFVIDTFCEEQFGNPIGIKQTHLDSLKASGDSPFEIEEKIIKLWRVNQRAYNLQQAYRIAAIIAGEETIKTMSGAETIYDINIPEKKVFTGKEKAQMYANIVNFKALPEYLRNAFSTTKISDSDYTIFRLDNPYTTFGLAYNDIVICDGESYRIRRVFNDRYFQVDREVTSGDYFRLLKIIPRNETKVYTADNYGFEEQFGENDSSKTINLGVVKFGDILWGDFLWGEKYSKEIDPICYFPNLSIGKTMFYGDPINQLISMDYYRGNTPPYMIQKSLAIDNRSFSQLEADKFGYNHTFLLTPFLSYSNRLDMSENDIRTETGWTLSSGTTSESVQKTNYLFTYNNITFDAAGDKLTFPVDLSDNNKTGLSLLRVIIRKTAGSVKIGINNDSSFLSTTSNKIFTDIEELDKWFYVNMFIDREKINQDSNKICIEAFDASTQIDIFGIEFYNSVPEYLEKLHKNKKIIEDFMSSNDYKIINLL